MLHRMRAFEIHFLASFEIHTLQLAILMQVVDQTVSRNWNRDIGRVSEGPAYYIFLVGYIAFQFVADIDRKRRTFFTSRNYDQTRHNQRRCDKAERRIMLLAVVSSRSVKLPEAPEFFAIIKRVAGCAIGTVYHQKLAFAVIVDKW